jgi:peptide deformylase
MKIVQYPHPALRHPARPLTSIDKKVRLQAGQMLELMYASRGLGLAGNQVAWPFQLFVCNLTADPNQRDQERVYINPVILERKGSVEGEEGCLSFPGLYQKVRRAKTIKVQAYDLNGQPVDPDASDMLARVIQHELDHLHGVLFIDKMGAIARLASRSALREFERDYRRAQERGEIPPDPEIEKQLKRLQTEADKPEPEPTTGSAQPPIL